MDRLSEVGFDGWPAWTLFEIFSREPHYTQDLDYIRDHPILIRDVKEEIAAYDRLHTAAEAQAIHQRRKYENNQGTEEEKYMNNWERREWRQGRVFYAMMRRQKRVKIHNPILGYGHRGTGQLPQHPALPQPYDLYLRWLLVEQLRPPDEQRFPYPMDGDVLELTPPERPFEANIDIIREEIRRSVHEPFQLTFSPSKLRDLDKYDLGAVSLRPDELQWLSPSQNAEYERILDDRAALKRRRDVATWLEQSEAPFDSRREDSRSVDNWRGIKLLGQGGFGKVGLWRNEKKDESKVDDFFDLFDSPAPEYVVKKTSLNPLPRGSLAKEASMMKLMNNSNHIVKLARGGGTTQQRTHTIYMEFLNGGSVQDLVERQKRIGYHLKGREGAEREPEFLSEKNLFQIFFCLAQGLLQMEGRDDTGEYPSNPARNPKNETLRPVINFDIKPANILIGPRNYDLQPGRPGKRKRIVTTPSDSDSIDMVPESCDHKEHRAFKIADFGLAHYDRQRPGPERGDPQRVDLRSSGTTDYFTPEQFDEEWDHGAWPKGEIAGRYGAWSNTFQVGIIMYQLALLSRPPSFEPYIYKIQDTFSHRQGSYKGTAMTLQSYGQSLDEHSRSRQNQQDPVTPVYSDTFVDLVHKCLARFPARRIKAKELYDDVRAAYQTLLDKEPDPTATNEFEDFDIGNYHAPYVSPVILSMVGK